MGFRAVLSAAWVMGWVALAGAPSARAELEKRVALVIGNGDYKNVPHLDNPPLDAKAIAEAFKGLGFEVVEGYNLDKDHMQKIVAEFTDALQDAKAAVVYYAGHGIAVDDENYLLPVDVSLKKKSELVYGAVGVSTLLKQMKQDDRANIIILDACRDNPFAELREKNRSTVVDRGLMPIDGDLARGTLIAFASDPRSTAEDGVAGEHSPFTEALLEHLEDPAAPIDLVMTRVRSTVWEKTHHTQRPWVNTSLIGEFSFNPRTATPPAPAAAPNPVAVAELPKPASPDRDVRETVLWQSAEQSNLSVDYQAYLEAFPDGLFAKMAKNRIAHLAAPAAAPSPSPLPAPSPVAEEGPIAPPEKDLKAEVGTRETEKSLGLTSADRKEIQQRLAVLEYFKGPFTGEFGDMTRGALADWQKKRGVAPTGMLGPVQVAALKAESESMYQRQLASQPYTSTVSRSLSEPRAHREPLHHHAAVAAGGPANVGNFIGGVAAGIISGTLLNKLGH
jgi:hypothetical protein